MSEIGNDFYKTFDRFEKLPEHNKNEYGAYQWYKEVTKDADATIACDCFQQIPLNLITDEMRKYAVSNVVEVLGLIAPEDTPAYTAICLIAYRYNYRAVGFFNEEVRTKEMVELLMMDPWALLHSYREYPWILQAMTPKLVEKFSLTNDEFMLSLPHYQVSEAALNKHLSEGDCTYSGLQKSGRLHLAVAFLKGGGWPKPIGPYDDPIPKPDSLGDAFSALLGEDIPRALYMAYVMTYPMADVMSLVVAPSCAKLVVEMYEEKELRPHIKNNRFLKATLLESSLGL